MKNRTVQKVVSLLLLVAFFLSTTTVSGLIIHPPELAGVPTGEDLDPLVDLKLTFTLKSIRAYDTIDRFTDPDFYVKVFFNDAEYTSPTWYNTKYVTDPDWTITYDVPDDQLWVNITIQLWDWNLVFDTLCDISEDYYPTNDQYDVELWYDVTTGLWWDDDYAYWEPTYYDPSGYGRLNGCDDGSIYREDRDCELWFDITQTDYDNDTLPYVTEVYWYGTDPLVDNTGDDDDGDGLPIEYEHRWRYDPFTPENHSTLDPDQDGLDNIEEYLTSQWDSDPFRQDIFLELDQMAIGPNGEGNFIPEGSKEMLRDAYGKHNIVLHIDDGCMGGGEVYPFDYNMSFDEIRQVYWEYFMHEDADNWRRGVFHWGIVTYHSDYYHGFAFPSFVEGKPMRLDCFHVATREHEVIPFKYPWLRVYSRKSLDKEYHREIIYASAMMHETGHVLGIFHDNTPGCDNQTGKFPWQVNWWIWRNYKSVMNYGWMYAIVDYSDGSHGKNDFDDWNRIDLTYFERDLYWR